MASLTKQVGNTTIHPLTPFNSRTATLVRQRQLLSTSLRKGSAPDLENPGVRDRGRGTPPQAGKAEHLGTGWGRKNAVAGNPST